MLDTIREILNSIGEVETIIIRSSIIICDMIGVVVIMTTVFKSIYHYFHRDLHIRLILARGIALALEFKLAGEVLRTVMVREWSELIVLGTIIVLRAAITVLIHWEMRTEKADEEQERKTQLEQENQTIAGK